MTEIVQLKTIGSSTLAEIHALQKQLSPDDIPVTPERLKSMLEDSHVEIWVVKDGQRIVGMATLIFALQLRELAGLVEDVVVDDGYRGQGLGKKLMEKLIERARARGAGKMKLTSRPHRVAAHKLYQGLGFEKKETNSYRLKL